MNQVDIGRFIAVCRKEKQLTQAQLAEKLNITDRAVSKWETGKSMPDASIMLELCQILGITVNELLSGERIAMENFDRKAEENLIELKKKDENNIKKNVIIAVIFSATLFIGMAVCLICDIAISGTLTWSPIPVSSIVLAWVISFPVIMLGRRGSNGALLALTIFILPYLYVLSCLIEVREVFSVGMVIAGILLVFLWMAFAIFRLLKKRKLAALGASLLLFIPAMLAVNAVLSKTIAEPVIDVWDILSAFLLLMLSFTFFICDYAKHKGFTR